MANYKVPVRDEFAWQSPVLDKDLNAAPGSPSKANRYIVGSTVASGDAWFGQEGKIAEYDGISAWDFYTPLEGWFTWIEDEDKLYKHDGASWSEFASGGGSADSNTKEINQAAHGLVVGNLIRLNGSSYIKGQADSVANAEIMAIVSVVAGVDDFTLCTGGYVSGLAGLTAGEVYFLSEITAGLLTTTEPSAEGEVSKPCFIADSTTSGYFFNMRGAKLAGNSYSYLETFDNGDLAAGILTVTHGLGEEFVGVTVWNNNGTTISVAATKVDSNSFTIDFSSIAPLSGTWHIRVTS